MPRSKRLARHQSIVGDVERRIACEGEDSGRGRGRSERSGREEAGDVEGG